jgi:hypothetical protein
MIDDEDATEECVMISRAARFADARRPSDQRLVQTELETCFGGNTDVSPRFDDGRFVEMIQTLIPVG